MPHAPVGWRDRLRYRFENTLSKGSVAIIGWLALVSLAIVLVSALLIALFHIDQDPEHHTAFSFGEGLWQSLMHTLDTGNLAADQGWGLRLLMLLVTLGGIFIVSILIGTVTSGMQTALEQLRKGRSRVIEQDHTLILGWSSKVYSIIGELLIANENQKKPRIVILAAHDKVQMEDDIRAKFPDTKNTLIICRSGDPLDLDALEVADPHAARSIVILAPEHEDNPDIHVIKSVLAITNNPRRKAGAYHIVAEIRDPKNLEAAALVGGEEAIYVQGDDLIARVTAQTCRQSGLSVVYTELLDFDGAEIYFKLEPALAGKTYRKALDAFEDSAVFGLMRANGEALVNPPMETVIEAGDQVIAVSEDDDTLVMGSIPPPMPDERLIIDGARPTPAPERTLVLGWNVKGEAILRELDNFVAPGSEIVVVCHQAGARDQLAAASKRLKRQKLQFGDGDITDRATLTALHPESFNHIILLSYSELPVQEADAKTLIALLHLRNLAETAGKRFSIVSEMMDLRNRALAQVARADDYIIGDKLVSLMLSQLSENKQLESVFKILFSAEGSEIYIRPVDGYLKTGEPVDFYTAIESAARKGETAIGYRQVAYADDKDRGYGVKVNPKKSDKISFAPGDQLIVLAED